MEALLLKSHLCFASVSFTRPHKAHVSGGFVTHAHSDFHQAAKKISRRTLKPRTKLDVNEAISQSSGMKMNVSRDSNSQELISWRRTFIVLFACSFMLLVQIWREKDVDAAAD